MATDAGLNTTEVQELLKSGGLAEEERRYLERVLEDRGVRKSVVEAHEIVAGNPDAYGEHVVEQQEQYADGRPHEAVKAEDTNIRGNEPAGEAAEKSSKVATKVSGNQNADKK